MSTNNTPILRNAENVNSFYQIPQACAHCQLLFPVTQLKQDPDTLCYFCCDGCQTVYNFLQSQNLGHYYVLRGEKKSSPINKTIHSEDFAFLDDPELNQDWVYCKGDKQFLQLYIEGVDCQACLWALTKLPELPKLKTHCLNARLNGEQSTLTLEISREKKFNDIMLAIIQMGMKPHPLRDQSEIVALEKKNRRRDIWRLAVAGASAGNAMLFAVPYYGGAALSAEWGRNFEFLILLTSMPALTYSAVPFYQKAIAAILKKQLSLDLPIALALFFGTVAGIWGFFVHKELLYVDSLASLVFLLSLARFSLKGLRRMNWSAKQIQHFFDMTPIECFNIQEQKWRSTPSGKLRLGDRIRVGMGKMIPVDAVLQSPLALVSLSYINGEATPKHLCRGDLLKAGTINTSETVELEVHNCAQESYLGKVLRSVGENWRQRPLDAASVDQLAMPITLITLIIAAIGFFYGYHQTGTWEMAFQRFLTIAIVSCPCALGIAAPLTWMRALSLAAGKGIVIKDEKVLERIANVRSIFFDKTGTLSAGQINVRSITTVSTHTEEQIANILLGIENGNQHPIAVAILGYIRSNYPESEATPMDKIWHVPGRGLEATAGQKHFQILSTPALSSDHKKLVLLEDNNPIAHLHVDEVLQHDTKIYMTKLLPLVERIGILSGDNDEHVKAMSNTLGLSPAYSLGELSASDKQHFVDQQETPMMVGDGANDMLALSGKAVGVVVQGGLELSMQSSDVWLAKPGISGVWQMLILARNTKRVLRRNVILSISYNVITISLAFFGILSPLTAAILMPLSSLAVLLNTLVGPYFPKEQRP